MANITKSFNFRNGVQVDDDNLLVNPSGLVGIGTTVPTQSLDVRGNAVVSGLVSSTDAKFTNLEVTNLTTGSNNLTLGIDKIIGAGVSIRAGIVTADLDTNPLGVVTYYGDGGQLNNIPTSQWVDKDAGLGFISIYNTGYVGVNTDDPRYSLQVGGNNDVNNFNKPGVGISSDGAIVASGIVTAHTFDGNSLGNIQGGIGTITQVLSTNVNVTGIVTAGIGFTGDLYGDVVGRHTGQVDGNVNSSGISTFNQLKVTGGISGDTVSGILTTGQLTASSSQIGISTASSIDIQGRLSVGTNNPAKNVEIFNVGITTVDIIGEEFALIQLGQRSSLGIGQSTAQVKFGEANRSFELINGDTGDFNCTIHGANFQGISTGGFNWIYGGNGSTLMNLDYNYLNNSFEQ